MAILHRGWMVGVGVGMVAVMGAAVSVSAVHSSGTPDTAVSMPAARAFNTPVSVHVIERIDETACPAGSAGVPGPSGQWCYLLGPGFELTRAERVEMGQDQGGDFAVNVVLVPEDRGGLAAWMEASVGSQIAYRVGDRVVSAPHVEESPGGDSFFLSPLSEAEAAALVEQMWP
jgi:hypothetical protein